MLAWRAPEPTLTVVVKATFSLGVEGTATLAAEQEPLSVDRPAPGGSHGDLDRACDFIPLKARVDILLTGHARAEAAMHVLPAGFAVDKLRRRFYANTEEPTFATPLLSDYLRSATGEATRVGPRALWAGTIDGAAIVGDDGVPCAPIPRGFDYAAFNVAPLEQQIELLSLTAQIVLDGLTPGGRRTARLPGIRPRVFVLADSNSGVMRLPDEVVLRCDTLWIDADRSLCVLTWRGVVPLAPNAQGAPSLVLALDEGDRKKTWARALTQLDNATWTAATEPDDVREAPEIESNHDHEDDDDDGPTTDRMQRQATTLDVAEPAPPAPAADDDESTRTNLRFSLSNLSEIDDDPSTSRPLARPEGDDATPAVASAPAPLMVLGGLRSSLASFEEKRPPSRPQRPMVLQFSRPEEDSTSISISISIEVPITPQGAAPALPFKVPTATPAGVTPPLPFTIPAAAPASVTPPFPFTIPRAVPAGATPALPFTIPGVTAPNAPAALPFKSPLTPPRGAAPTLPFVRAPLTPPQGASPTLPFVQAPQGAAPTLPFAQSSIPSALPFTPSAAIDPLEMPRAAALPFVRSVEAGTTALPFTAPISPALPFSRASTIVPDSPRAAAASALPFTPSAGLLALARGSASALPALGDLPSAPPPPPPVAPSMSWLLAKAPALTVGESIIADTAPELAKVPQELAVEVAPSGLSMERYAEIKAEIWGSRASVADVLQLRDLDEAAFHDHERRLAEGLAREAAEGQSTLARALRDALSVARDHQQSTGERPLRTLEEAYVTLLAALDRAEDPSAILAAKGMSPAQWRRLRRRFEERAGADAKLRDTLSTKLAAARKVVGNDTGNGSKWWNRRETTPAKAKRVPAKRRSR